VITYNNQGERQISNCYSREDLDIFTLFDCHTVVVDISKRRNLISV